MIPDYTYKKHKSVRRYYVAVDWIATENRFWTSFCNVYEIFACAYRVNM